MAVTRKPLPWKPGLGCIWQEMNKKHALWPDFQGSFSDPTGKTWHLSAWKHLKPNGRQWYLTLAIEEPAEVERRRDAYRAKLMREAED